MAVGRVRALPGSLADVYLPHTAHCLPPPTPPVVSRELSGSNVGKCMMQSTPHRPYLILLSQAFLLLLLVVFVLRQFPTM